MIHTDAPMLRAHLRKICAEAGVAAERRARLVLTVSLLTEPVFDNGAAAGLTASTVDDALVVTLRLPGPVERNSLPLLPDTSDGAILTWHLPTGPEPVPAASDDETAGRQEMLALVARNDALVQEQRDLKHELGETNSGVLAMYVELEQRDEQLRRAHAVIFRELEDALRPRPPAVPGLELAVHYAATGQDAPTGGDLYDWFVLPDGSLHVTLVDAVGHGVTSTRHALTVTHAIRTLVLEGHPFRDLVARTSRTLASIEPDLMATVVLASLDPATGELRLANGSHPRPVLVTADGHAEFLAAAVTGRGVGFPAPGTPSIIGLTLRRGETLLLYTDGLIEGRKDLTEGEERLLAMARRLAGLPTAELPGRLVAGMHDVVLHADDTVVIAIRR